LRSNEKWQCVLEKKFVGVLSATELFTDVLSAAVLDVILVKELVIDKVLQLVNA
jgi:hypothetical protein